MIYTYCAQTDPGLSRPNNEDAVAWDARCGLAVLADGMGGYNAGEVASRMATELIQAELAAQLVEPATPCNPGQIRQAMVVAVKHANQSILRQAREHPEYSGMGTTLVLAIFRDRQLFLTHIGDSRCYRWRAGVLTQLTKDHSLLQEQIDAGLLTSAQATSAPGKNLLTRALGVEPEVAFEIQSQPVEAGDLYLMCSDGLTDMVDDASLARTLAHTGDLKQRVSTLIELANFKGGRDNIAVVLTQAHDESDTQHLTHGGGHAQDYLNA